MCHEEHVAYEGQTVEDFVNRWAQTWQPMWSVSEIGYGVIRAQDGLASGDWPEHAPSGLKWVGKAWHAGMTMEELFAGVALKENERFFLVISKLDVKTKHIGPMPVEEDTRLGVQNAVYWLSGLYRDVNGMLRDLKAQA